MSAQWQLLFRTLPRAHRGLAIAWWTLTVIRALLPAALIVATGRLIGAVADADTLTGPLTAVAALFVATRVLSPIHDAVSGNLGARVAGHHHERLLAAATAADGIAHLEDPALADDFSLARDFDLGITGPPISVSMPFVANGLVELVSGLAAAAILSGYRWWAPPVLVGAWLATHRLLRESTIWRNWRNDEIVALQRHADYAYRLATDAPAAKEVRLFGLAGWVVDRFGRRRRTLLDLSLQALRLRQRRLWPAVTIAAAANALILGLLAHDASRLTLTQLTTYAGATIGAAVLGVADFGWWFDTAARPGPVIDTLTGQMPARGHLPPGHHPATGLPRHEIRLRGLTFAYPGREPVFDGLDLRIPAGRSLAIVGQNGADKTTLAKLLCRLHDPTGGSIDVDGHDLRTLDLPGWRDRVTAVFQDFIRYEDTLRANVAPRDAPEPDIAWALHQAGASDLAAPTTILSKAYAGGTDLSGGQWQRLALARAMTAVRAGAGLVILDEPTAQLDIRGEAEIFRRVLDATRGRTTILISHRFSTVRQADLICVLEAGQVVEQGTHDQLMARRGRYHTMYTLQAARFEDPP
ncbi:ABC transporter ATP-binding protein [Paractinoplanes rhizophilus]|uniref:ABC transporter ATP-binding protein n=1 Tax=Paractinoplanes rhizophilus TaxID=1416877 RepID=A0ABW2HP23_9ACTN